MSPDAIDLQRPLSELAAALDAARTTSRALTEQALARIADPAGQGAVVFTHVDAQAAREAADGLDALRRAGVRLSPLMGIPVSVKDLFDVAGQVTRAGSKVLSNVPAATRDALAVARLRQAGAVVVGRTNMTEFAFSGLGLNPHYGTPRSPWQREVGHIAGGSSSGAAASVADGMAAVALGTDTGGSIRIPSAFCGLTGFKPTAARTPREGALPLSTSLDSVGPIGRSVDCCARVDAILSGNAVDEAPLAPRNARGMRFGVLTNYVLDGAQPAAIAIYERALAALAKAGATLVEFTFRPFDDLPAINRFGFSPIEAYAWHRERLAQCAHEYDPRVLVRIRKGEPASAADYLDLIEARAALIAAATPVWQRFDAVLCPTVPLTPPAIAPLEASDETFTATNALVLRNPTAINMIDGCAFSLPCQAAGEAPIGLMLSGAAGDDARLFPVARAVEHTLRAAGLGS
ncbi:amidase [Pandoraea nosoerga]|uniref:Amidase n=1 Tax=Pandoraea nosoerga TaxID=2508296 RepID=A0A5E4U017_9BURK|nr:amidase [Pandoraea nosoerga]MBN4666651.1 amidase [Pandoraea nosoerga]MBN4676764.1 amidase [Pandoraea nosoerga]MBN4682775.1 amidase [Pandoraea nosoerga]MBN4745826.1 amidase [Pandoraea nosoerga]VVD93437.1 amidase [Pandoraea nosoerga]